MGLGLGSGSGLTCTLVESMSRRDAERWRVVERSGLRRSGGRGSAVTCLMSSGFASGGMGGRDMV